MDQRGRRLPWVPLADVSPAFIRIMLRAEDKRFYDHGGVDWLALSDAALYTVILVQAARSQHTLDASRRDARA